MSDLVSKDSFDRLPERYRVRAREIARRVSEIDALLAPCRPEAIRDAVIRLRGQLRPQPDIDPRDLASEFKAACRDLPEWALSEATNDFLAGRVENHTGQFMPTCAEFAKHARSVLTPFYSERLALRVEASKLIERAEDDRRRHLIEIERQDPAVRERVSEMIEKATKGQPKQLPLRHAGLSEDKQRQIDAFKKPQPFQSKIAQTKIVTAQQKAKQG